MSPRLHGYRERRYANFYDSVDVPSMRSTEALFGNANVGNRERCNLQIAGQTGSDQTLVIVNVYVRTNICRQPKMNVGTAEVVRDAFLEGDDQRAIGMMIQECQWERTPVAKAFDQWAHTAVAELIIGYKSSFSMNVFDLMDGPALGPGRVPEGPLPKDDDDNDIRLPWRKQIGIPVIVPVRQNFQVRVNSNGVALANLQRALQLGPDVIIPAPLVWVHLEGMESRDVA